MIGFPVRWRVLNLNRVGSGDHSNVYKLLDGEKKFNAIEISVLIRFDLNKITIEFLFYQRFHLLPPRAAALVTIKLNLFRIILNILCNKNGHKTRKK